ncbi:EF-hand domain-containing protein [Thiolapillus sp.]
MSKKVYNHYCRYGAWLLPMVLLSSIALADGGGIYSVYDQDTNGYLDSTEFESFLKKRRIKKEFRHLWAFEKVDKDQDGKISNQEFVDTLKQEMDLRKATKKAAF